MRRAGFGIRLGAAAIDLVFMYLLYFLASMCVVPLFVVSQRNAPPGSGSGLLFHVILVLNTIVWVAYTLTEVFGAATPAKRLLKLRVAAPDGGPAPATRKLGRWAMKYAPLFAYLVATGFFFQMIDRQRASSQPLPMALLVLPQTVAGLLTLVVGGGFFATLSSNRQALHDILAGTVVLRPGDEPQGFAPIMVVPSVPVDAPSQAAQE